MAKKAPRGRRGSLMGSDFRRCSLFSADTVGWAVPSDLGSLLRHFTSETNPSIMNILIQFQSLFIQIAITYIFF